MASPLLPVSPESGSASCLLLHKEGLTEFIEELKEMERRLKLVLGATSAVFALHEAKQVFDLLLKLEELRAKIKETLPHESKAASLIDMIESDIQTIRVLESSQPPLHHVRKWIEAGYCPESIDSDPESVSFVVESGLLFSLKMFQEAKAQLEKEDVDLHFEHGQTLIKVEGSWKPYSEVKRFITYHPDTKKIEGWSYTHPRGFVPSDTLNWSTLQSCAQLSVRAYREAMAAAQRFWDAHAEVDAGLPKECVLQVAVKADTRLSESALLQTCEDMMPRHVRLRLIDENRHVYSFSTLLTQEDSDYIFGYIKTGAEGFSLRTVDTKIASPDYEESRSFQHCHLVSLPLTRERFSRIKDTVEQLNKQGGIRFCLTRQNCCRFSQEMLKLAGVEVDTRLTVPTFFYRLLPSLDSLPLIGKPLASLAKRVAGLFTQLSFFLRTHSPKPLLCVGHILHDIVTYIPRKIAILVSNLFCLALGAAQGKKSCIQKNVDKPIRVHFDSFSRLIASPLDLFKKETSQMYHSRLMIEWMKKQSSYLLLQKHPSGLVFY